MGTRPLAQRRQVLTALSGQPPAHYPGSTAPGPRGLPRPQRCSGSSPAGGPGRTGQRSEGGKTGLTQHQGQRSRRRVRKRDSSATPGDRSPYLGEVNAGAHNGEPVLVHPGGAEAAGRRRKEGDGEGRGRRTVWHDPPHPGSPWRSVRHLLTLARKQNLPWERRGGVSAGCACAVRPAPCNASWEK